MNKRGQISIETIIIIVLALLVLIIVAAAFSGGMREFMARIGLIGGQTAEITLEDATTRCNTACNNGASAGVFCSTTYQIKDIGSKSCSQIVPGSVCKC